MFHVQEPSTCDQTGHHARETNLPYCVGQVLEHNILQSVIIRQNPHPEPSIQAQRADHADVHLLPLLHLLPVFQHQACRGVHQVGHVRHEPTVRGPWWDGVREQLPRLIFVLVQQSQLVVKTGFVAG